jgi:phage shock protein PspC (stress-responsive transcriptional regulator)
MNEITRIHIAKVPYDIEIGAKKELETYINKLSRYANDVELLADIEIRITELLVERHVEKDGIISAQDVEAIRDQLGEPEEFLDDGDIAVGQDTPHRRFYRDYDGAIVGGVLSGIARYLNTDPLWTRLIFLVLLFVSFGIAVIAYLVVWAITPPARTAAEKLEMAGKPITLASIKTLNEQSDATDSRGTRLAHHILRYGAGAAMAFSALLAATATVAGAFATGYWDSIRVDAGLIGNTLGWVYTTVYALLITSGILLTVLFIVLAVAIFKWAWSKQTTVATVLIVVAGLITFGSGIALYTYGVAQDRAFVEGNQSVSQARLPDGFAQVTNIVADTGSTSAIIVYTVDPNFRYELRAMKDVYKPIIEVNGQSATISIKTLDERRAQYSQPLIQIYGPALTDITLKSGVISYYNSQDTLTVTDAGGNMTIGGSFETVTVSNTDSSAVADLSGASIAHLSANTGFGVIIAGSVKTLALTQPEACARNTLGRFSASAVTSGVMTYNGVSRAATTMILPCSRITIGESTE